MQTIGGGKHDILSVARASVTTLDCLFTMPREPDSSMCLNAFMNASRARKTARRTRAFVQKWIQR